MTNPRRIATVAYKEWREIVRDRLFFALAFIVPSTLMIFFGFGLSLDVEDLPLAIIDRDGSALSRDYAHRFIDSRYFDFQGYAGSLREVEPMIALNELRLVIVIPENFQKDLQSGRPAHVQTVIDGTFPFRAQVAKGYIAAINNAVSLELLTAYVSRSSGVPRSQALEQLTPVSLEVRYLYNQSVKSIWSLAPKLIMIILLISPPFLTALGIVREKERGSIYNIYASTVSRGEFLIGKLAPYIGISLINAALLWLLATALFGAPFKGSILFFGLVTALYVTCTTGIGLVVSVIAQTQVAAMIASAILTVVPAVLYSGVLIPVESLGTSAQLVAHALPAMYYTNVVLASFLKGVGLEALVVEVAVLALYAAALFTAGFQSFHKRPSV